MVEQMKYFSMVGPVAGIDAVVEKHLSEYDIHFEQAAHRMAHNEGIQPFNESNPYTELLGRAARLTAGINTDGVPGVISDTEAETLVNEAYRSLEERENKIKSLQAEQEAVKRYMEQLEGFSGLPVNLGDLDKFEYIYHEFGRFAHGNFLRFEKLMGRGAYRAEPIGAEAQSTERKISAIKEYLKTIALFDGLDMDIKEVGEFKHTDRVFGRLPYNNFKQFERFCSNDKDIIFQECGRSRDFVWGVYFTPSVKRSAVDSFFSSLHFEQIPVTHIFMDEDVSGTPGDIIDYWNLRIMRLERQLQKAETNAQAEQNAMHASRFDDSEILFIQGEDDGENVWGVYFTPVTSRDKVSALFKSLHFEKLSVTNTFMGESLSGTPEEILKFWRAKLYKLEMAEKNASAYDIKKTDTTRLSLAYANIKARYGLFEVKRYAAITNDKTYTFVGWIRSKDAKTLSEALKDENSSVYIRDDDGDEPGYGEEPPVLLKNPPVIRQFEFFTKMYGVPSRGEFDPTPVLAVVYTILYGLMFGDVGQGLCISLLGLYFYRARKIPLGGVMVVLGVSASVFGFLYGSVFGMEDLIPALWHRPQEDITGTLIYAVAVGAIIILTAMLLNIVNAARHKNWGEMFFSSNGVAGLVFYGAVLFTVARVFLWGRGISVLNIIFVLLPLVFVAIKEPVVKYLAGERKASDEGIVMYVVGLVLEMVEVLLSYATNTISFIRVGAFAISHAGMMHVVLMLAGSANDTRNPLVMIVGNLLVIIIEGFLVGIQVLRLDFYELFSRFYKGGGQLFTPYKP